MHERARLLYDAIMEQDADAVQRLIANGVELEHTDRQGSTPLIVAASGPSARIMRSLLRGGANPNATNQLGATALGVAIRETHYECIALLLEYGADPNRPAFPGVPALHLAVKLMSRSLRDRQIWRRIFALLASAGADCGAVRTADGFPFLKLPDAMWRSHCMRLFEAGVRADWVARTALLTVRRRAGTVAIALQELELPAWCTLMILRQTTAPFGAQVDLQSLWRLTVTVKHFLCRSVYTHSSTRRLIGASIFFCTCHQARSPAHAHVLLMRHVFE